MVIFGGRIILSRNGVRVLSSAGGQHHPRTFTIREGIKMTTVIFFGGLIAGFLIGWVGMALLTLSSVRNRQEEFKAPLYHELTQTRG
jgi:hypothetical protein